MELNTSEQLLEAISNNCKKCSELRRKIDYLKFNSINTCSNDLNQDDLTDLSVEKSMKNDESLEFDDLISFYLNNYKNLDEDFSLDNILNILPSRDSSDFIKIVYRLQLESIREIRDINEIISEDEDISHNDLLEYKNLINIENKKISLLTSLINNNVCESSEEKVKNTLILVPTEYGNRRVIEEIKSIPSEYYPDFLALINSIVDGKFKNPKHFTNNSILTVDEVRGFKVRLVFERIDSNVYALITAFVKKCDCDNYYRSSLENKVAQYHIIKDKLKSLLNDDLFMRENQLVVDELYKILTPKVKELKKGGLNE